MESAAADRNSKKIEAGRDKEGEGGETARLGTTGSNRSKATEVAGGKGTMLGKKAPATGRVEAGSQSGATSGTRFTVNLST
ncbi:hypothetical protein BaRGS_00029984 [Batillaria attramentaria]|uniref:Uncharacterized protein n=1 Tax=Batillaria attramentaria TaxID=370345 RepID=A0ABD0JV37_9CAEN